MYPTHGPGRSVPHRAEPNARRRSDANERGTRCCSSRRGRVRRRAARRVWIVSGLLLPPPRGQPPRAPPLRNRSRLARLELDKFRELLDQGAQLVDVRPIGELTQPATSRGRCRSSCGPCSRAGSAGSSTRPSGRVRARRRPGPPRARPPMPRPSATNTSRASSPAAYATWRDASLPNATIELVGPGHRHRIVLDVRQRERVRRRHVPGARNIELGALDAVDDLPTGQLTVMCGHGERAMTGASVLDRARTPRRRGARRRPRRLGGGHRPRPRGRCMSARDTPPHDPSSRAAREPRPVLAARRRQRARRRDDRPGTHRPAAARRRRVRPHRVHRHAHVHRRVRRGQGATNFFAGTLSDRVGRKPVLVAGWLIGLPVPLLLIWAPTWGWIVFANVLLGVNQGLTWSTTVIMKIDLVGPERRGLAMGLNEAAGYGAVALTALATGFIAEHYGLRPEPFFLGIAYAGARPRPLDPVRARDPRPRPPRSAPTTSTTATRSTTTSSTREVFTLTSFRETALSSCSQAGLVNNLNDGLAWGIFPALLRRRRPVRRPHRRPRRALPRRVGTRPTRHRRALRPRRPQAAHRRRHAHPSSRDRAHRRHLTASGRGPLGAALLGVGTAMVYPTLLAAIGDVAHPAGAHAPVGVYRLWRDAGFAFGALLAGIIADAFGSEPRSGPSPRSPPRSGVVVAIRMYETHPTRRCETYPGLQHRVGESCHHAGAVDCSEPTGAQPKSGGTRECEGIAHEFPSRRGCANCARAPSGHYGRWPTRAAGRPTAPLTHR